VTLQVVLDANTLASGAVAAPGTTLAEVIDRWMNDEYGVVLSQEILTELQHTFANPYFTTRLSVQERTAYLTFVAQHVLLIPITAKVQGIATHPEDDVVLATAASANASYLVTGDRKLQGLGRYKEIHILSPAAFLAVLRNREQQAA
jgi:putative PIN family toxin of toxin-antitoxin system